MSLFFTVDGTEYEFDQNKLSLAEAIAIKKESGLTVVGFQAGLQVMDPEALQAMVWLAKKRAGIKTRMQDIDFDVVDFSKSLRNEDTAPPITDPTQGSSSAESSPNALSNGTIQSGDVLTTSDHSPTTWVLPQ